MAQQGGALRVVSVPVEQIRPLRHRILRDGLPLSDSVYPQDDEPTTTHFAAIDDELVIGCATVFPEPLDTAPAWRLRGMAVVEERRGMGVGGRLLAEVLTVVRRNEGKVLWCNSRAIALPFYTRQGFRVVAEEFLAAGDIPHYLTMVAVPTP